MRVREDNAVRHVGFGECGGMNFSGEVTGLVGIAFAATRPAAQFEADIVFREDDGQALHFSGIRDRKQDLIPGSGELFHLFEHGRYRTVEASSRLRQQSDGGFSVFVPGDAEMFEISSGQGCDFLPPVIGRKIQVRRANKVPYAAALMRFFHSSPETIEFRAQEIRFIEKHGGIGQQVEYGAVRACDGCVKLPARENCYSGRANGAFHNFFIADDALAREAAMDGAEQLLADRSLGEWQEQSFVDRVGRALRSWIEAADGVHFIAKELDAHGAFGFRGVDIENAATDRVLAGHFNYVGRTVSNCIEVAEQTVEIKGLARRSVRARSE